NLARDASSQMAASAAGGGRLCGFQARDVVCTVGPEGARRSASCDSQRRIERLIGLPGIGGAVLRHRNPAWRTRIIKRHPAAIARRVGCGTAVDSEAAAIRNGLGRVEVKYYGVSCVTSDWHCAQIDC